MDAAYQAALSRLTAKAEKHVMGQAMAFHSEVVQQLSVKGTGRVYGVHQASAPGAPPAVNSGLLRQSTAFARLAPLTWGVGMTALPYPEGGATTAEVAVFLEYGTRTIAPRPFMRPALQAFKARRMP